MEEERAAQDDVAREVAMSRRNLTPSVHVRERAKYAKQDVQNAEGVEAQANAEPATGEALLGGELGLREEDLGDWTGPVGTASNLVGQRWQQKDDDDEKDEEHEHVHDQECRAVRGVWVGQSDDDPKGAKQIYHEEQTQRDRRLPAIPWENAEEDQTQAQRRERKVGGGGNESICNSTPSVQAEAPAKNGSNTHDGDHPAELHARVRDDPAKMHLRASEIDQRNLDTANLCEFVYAFGRFAEALSAVDERGNQARNEPNRNANPKPRGHVHGCRGTINTP